MDNRSRKEDLAGRIYSAAAKYVKDEGPGFSFLLAKDGDVLFRGALGLADIERGVRIRPENNFIIASNTKQFTCLAVLMLRDRGLLGLDETIERFFPDFPDYRKEVTVRMLMCHTSGIKDYFDTDFERNKSLLRKADTKEMLGIAKGFGNELNFSPGTRFSYCNTSYVMLGDIVRQLSGVSFGSFIEKEILRPLGMDRSFAPDDMYQRDPYLVKGYEAESGRGFNPVPYDMLEVGYADGNISSNIDDMLKWHRYLFDSDDERLISRESLKELYAPQHLNDGTGIPYGLGLMTGDLDKDHRKYSERREIWHTGGSMGFISRISYFPDERLSAIMLTNWCGIERDRLFSEIMDAAFRKDTER